MIGDVLVAHVSGLPVEELVPLWSGAGGLLVMRPWLAKRIRDRIKR